MVRDLPDFYKNEGYVGRMLEDCRSRKDDIWGVRIDLNSKNTWTGISFFSRGDFRNDAVEAAKQLIDQTNKYAEIGPIKLPEIWEKYVLGTKKISFNFEVENDHLGIGAYSLNRIAEMAKDSCVENPRQDEEGRLILDRKEFLTEFRGRLVDTLLNGVKSCFSSACNIPQPPNDEDLARQLQEAGEVYDQYFSIPQGSLMVTEDFIFPYAISRKEFADYRCPFSAKGGYSYKFGPRVETADRNFQFTGVDTDCARHLFKNPVFRGTAGFNMPFLRSTYVVNKEDEKNLVKGVVDSLGKFNSTWIQDPPKKFPDGMDSGIRNGDWEPTKVELIRGINYHLSINED
jgi:hypothetical protein